MNDTSSKYDKWLYEPKIDSHEEYAFKPTNGIGPFEWSNIASLARAIKNLIFVDSCLCTGVRTTEGHFERHARDGKADLCEALAEAVIEVDERRKHRMANGYADGGQIHKDVDKGMTEEAATRKAVIDAAVKMGIRDPKKGGKKCRK